MVPVGQGKRRKSQFRPDLWLGWQFRAPFGPASAIDRPWTPWYSV